MNRRVRKIASYLSIGGILPIGGMVLIWRILLIC